MVFIGFFVTISSSESTSSDSEMESGSNIYALFWADFIIGVGFCSLLLSDETGADIVTDDCFLTFSLTSTLTFGISTCLVLTTCFV